MNNIYFQISNNIKARRLVELTSEMLRYQLYECNEKYVPLKQEIVYFNNYLEVTQMKGIKSERIDFYVGQGVEDEVIAPLVLTLILESAIEYLKGCDKTMYISLIKNDNKLVYEVKTWMS
jgi:LytS/YehU family sensor histidine kinase